MNFWRKILRRQQRNHNDAVPPSTDKTSISISPEVDFEEPPVTTAHSLQASRVSVIATPDTFNKPTSLFNIHQNTFQQRSCTSHREHQILPSRSTMRTTIERRSNSECRLSDKLIILTGSTSTAEIRHLIQHATSFDPMATYFRRSLSFDETDAECCRQTSAPKATITEMSSATKAFKNTNSSFLGITTLYRLQDNTARAMEDLAVGMVNDRWQEDDHHMDGATGYGRVMKQPISRGPNDVFAEQCLQAHNNYRRRHGASDLHLDDELMEHAQRWANVLAAMDRMEHNPKRSYGENLFSCGHFEPTGHQVVRAWYSEVGAYNFAEPQFNKNTGHFTALLWAATRSLGVGMQRSTATGQFYVVANYDPPGNVSGKFERNVLRPSVVGLAKDVP